MLGGIRQVPLGVIAPGRPSLPSVLPLLCASASVFSAPKSKMWHSPSNVVTTRTFFKRGPHHHSADKAAISVPPTGPP